MLANLANLTLDQVEKPDKLTSQEEWDSLQASRVLLKQYLRIYDTQCKLEELPMRVRRHQAEFGPLLDWMAVDHLGVIDTGHKSQSSADWSRDLEQAAYQIKNNVCKPYSVCSVAFSQIPGEVKKQLDLNNRTNNDALRGGIGVKNAADIFVIGGRHSGKFIVDKKVEQGAPEYRSATFFQTTKSRRAGANGGYSVLRFDGMHHRLLNETLPSYP